MTLKKRKRPSRDEMVDQILRHHYSLALERRNALLWVKEFCQAQWGPEQELGEYDRILKYMVANQLVEKPTTQDKAVPLHDFGLEVSIKGGWLKHLARERNARWVQEEITANKESRKEERETKTAKYTKIAELATVLGLIITAYTCFFSPGT